MRTRIESIDLYMNDIRKYPRITTDEENRLAGIIANGTPEERQAALDKLVCANLRLVVKIAHDFKSYGLGFADLVAEGNLGLSRAAVKFDPSKGAKFSCYAAWWIKQAIRKALMWQGRTVRVPGGSAQKLQAITKARAAYMTEHGTEPDIDTLADITGLTVRQIETLDRAATETFSMDAPVSEDSATTFDQMLAETVEEDDREERDRRSSALDKALAALSQLDRFIITRLFGLDCEAMDVRMLSQETGLSADSVQRHADAALVELRELMVM